MYRARLLYLTLALVHIRYKEIGSDQALETLRLPAW
jgi:hypothetical protein